VGHAPRHNPQPPHRPIFVSKDFYTEHAWWKTLLTLSYTSAGRRDELLNLTWADVDFDRQNVRFSPKEASEFLLAWEPKDHEGRTIPIPDDGV
jgi:integrase